jgi:hypothetical protein
MACAICETRRPRRFCPAVGGDICALCCGTEREVSVECPFECEYLVEARKREKPADLDPEAVPHKDIRIPERFLEENEELLVFLGRTLLSYALTTPGTIDFDVREALDALIRTYRTLESGVYYESVPTNPLAASLFHAVQNGVRQYREQERQGAGVSRTRDTDVLGLLVFLSRVELDRNNGRRRGRSFLDGLRNFFPDETETGQREPSSLILP